MTVSCSYMLYGMSISFCVSHLLGPQAKTEQLALITHSVCHSGSHNRTHRENPIPRTIFVVVGREYYGA